jgi:hypothetical protein
MRSFLVYSCKPILALRIAFIWVLVFVSCGWTCSAIFHWGDNCFDTVMQPQIISVWPGTISSRADSAVLIVSGSDFIAQSQILWNGNALPTTFINSRRLEAIITQQTFVSFGVAAGSSVQISVISPRSSFVVGCSTGWTSGILVVFIT